jgi:C1A family cysteine protease
MSVLLWKVLIPALALTIICTAFKREESAIHSERHPLPILPKMVGVVADYREMLNKTPIILSTRFLTTLHTAGNSNSGVPLPPLTDAAGMPIIHAAADTTVVTPRRLPSKYSLVMPAVRHQGTEGSCVAFAVTYTRACEEYYKTKAEKYSDASNVFSPEYVFNQVRSGEDGLGSGILSSLDLIKNQGVCTWQCMPYSSTNGCSVLPSTAQSAEAANHKITSYARIINSDQTAIKTMIAAKHPVIASFTIDQSFYHARPGFVWKSLTGNSGSHTMALCGYDDKKHAFKAINSWGATWGDAGYIWIDYDFFPATASYYTYIMTL